MNYNVFKSMLDVLVKTYKCPFCNSEVWENNIDIVWAAWTTLNIDIDCPSCHKHSIVKAEVAHLDAKTMNFPVWASINEIKENLSTMLKKDILDEQEVPKNAIKDKDIVSLNRTLQAEEIKIEDLFN